MSLVEIEIKPLSRWRNRRNKRVAIVQYTDRCTHLNSLVRDDIVYQYAEPIRKKPTGYTRPFVQTTRTTRVRFLASFTPESL